MKKLYRSKRGNATVIFALSLTAFFGMLALSSDVGVMLVAKNQIQSAIDASALAAASGLVVNQGEALQRGLALSNRNTIISQPLALQVNEISFEDSRTVWVAATRTVNLFFSRMFGIDNIQVSAAARAQLGNRDIVLLFDRSGSMDDDTIYPHIPQPITDTKTAAKYLVDKIEQNGFTLDRMGLVSYSTWASRDEDLSRNFQQIRSTINSYEADGFTNIGDAILEASGHLISEARWRTYKIEVLLSDGNANRPWNVWYARWYALQKARDAAQSNIKIFTISLGNDTDWELMEEIAEITRGRHYYAPTPAELDEIFEEIASWLPTVLVT